MALNPKKWLTAFQWQALLGLLQLVLLFQLIGLIHDLLKTFISDGWMIIIDLAVLAICLVGWLAITKDE